MTRQTKMRDEFLLLLAVVVAISCGDFASAFTVTTGPALLQRQARTMGVAEPPSTTCLWMTVENPFKNPELLKSSETSAGELLEPRMGGTNLFLVGIMGSGKSAVGKLVAKSMGTYKFLDTDDVIEDRAGKKISDIFEDVGEEGFRKVETETLDTLKDYTRCIMSTGGGLVIKDENWPIMKTGVVVWLDVDPTVIIKRLKGDTGRPLLRTENPLKTLQDLLEQRRSKYERSDVRIEVTGDMDQYQTADAVIEALHDYVDENPQSKKEGKEWEQ